MSQEKPQEEPAISEEAEAAARADRERLFHSEIPRVSEQAVIAAQLGESMGRALGFDPSKVPTDLPNRLQTLREQVSGREPPPLEESRVPPTGIAPTEE
jgi:hypothetical protein